MVLGPSGAKVRRPSLFRACPRAGGPTEAGGAALSCQRSVTYSYRRSGRKSCWQQGV